MTARGSTKKDDQAVNPAEASPAPRRVSGIKPAGGL
jgi:hypothetical protein